MPKCGGTSVGRAITDALHARYPLRRIPEFHLDAIASRQAARALGQPVLVHREHLLVYALGLRHLALIGGHFPLSSAALAVKAPDDIFVTVLREPRSRLLSEYYYDRFKTGGRARPIDLDLEAWLESEAAPLSGTTLVRNFCGDSRLSGREPATVSEAEWKEATRHAIENIGTLEVVGDISRLSDFAEAFRTRTGLTLKVGHRMRSPKPTYPKFAEQPEPIRRKVEELCRHDIEIYETVQPAMAT